MHFLSLIVLFFAVGIVPRLVLLHFLLKLPQYGIRDPLKQRQATASHHNPSLRNRKGNHIQRQP